MGIVDVSKKTIQIAYCMNDSFAEAATVSITSCLHNTNRDVKVYFIFNTLSAENRQRISDTLIQFAHVESSFVEFKIPEDSFKGRFAGHYAKENYYRMFLPELLPDVERIIYLDADTVVTGDIGELWDCDLNSKTIGAVADPLSCTTERKELLGIDNDGFCFNSGVMLINMAQLKSYNIVERTDDIISDVHRKIISNGLPSLVDQDSLNYLLKNDVCFLSPIFNHMDFYRLIDLKLHCPSGVSFTEWGQVFSNPVVIHYIGWNKPWTISNEHPHGFLWEKYFDYKKQTAFHSEHDIQLTEMRKEAASNTSKYKIKFFDAYLLCYWYNLYEAAAIDVKSRLGDRLLVFWGASNRTEIIAAIFLAKELNVFGVIDGVSQDKLFYGRKPLPADILLENKGNCFVVICIEKYVSAQVVEKQLINSYGLTPSSVLYIYNDYWKHEDL